MSMDGHVNIITILCDSKQAAEGIDMFWWIFFATSHGFSEQVNLETIWLPWG